MNILSWIVFGGVTGTVISLVEPRGVDSGGGVISAIILGILGALFGGLLANLILGASIEGFSLAAFGLAMAGSLVLLSTGRLLRKFQ